MFVCCGSKTLPKPFRLAWSSNITRVGYKGCVHQAQKYQGCKYVVGCSGRLRPREPIPALCTIALQPTGSEGVPSFRVLVLPIMWAEGALLFLPPDTDSSCYSTGLPPHTPNCLPYIFAMQLLSATSNPTLTSIFPEKPLATEPGLNVRMYCIFFLFTLACSTLPFLCCLPLLNLKWQVDLQNRDLSCSAICTVPGTHVLLNKEKSKS